MGQFSGVIAGYDPGGNDGHGFALAEFRNGRCKRLQVETLANAEAVISNLVAVQELAAIGIDTLAAWAKGASGWRVADIWLRHRYKEVLPSIVSPNGLYGSMGLNGMAVLVSVRQTNPQVRITETHPKILYWALTRTRYNYPQKAAEMDGRPSDWLGFQVKSCNDHEWDAVVWVVAAARGLEGEWVHDLFQESAGKAGRMVFPAGEANYWWPE